MSESNGPPFNSEQPRPTGQVRGFPGTAGAVDPAAAIEPPFNSREVCAWVWADGIHYCIETAGHDGAHRCACGATPDAE